MNKICDRAKEYFRIKKINPWKKPVHKTVHKASVHSQGDSDPASCTIEVHGIAFYTYVEVKVGGKVLCGHHYSLNTELSETGLAFIPDEMPEDYDLAFMVDDDLTHVFIEVK